MNIGQQLLRDGIDAGLSDMNTMLYAGAAIVVLLVLRMVKVSLNTASHKSRMR
jgi:hypothetical protein